MTSVPRREAAGRRIKIQINEAVVIKFTVSLSEASGFAVNKNGQIHYTHGRNIYFGIDPRCGFARCIEHINAAIISFRASYMT